MVMSCTGAGYGQPSWMSVKTTKGAEDGLGGKK